MNKKRTKAQVILDRLELEKLYFVELWTIQQIQAHFAQTRDYTLSHTQLIRDRDRVLQDMRERMGLDLNSYISIQLSKLDVMERELWGEWHKSKESTIETKSRVVLNRQNPRVEKTKKKPRKEAEPGAAKDGPKDAPLVSLSLEMDNPRVEARRVEEKVEKQHLGDVSYLVEIRRVQEFRMKLLGILGADPIYMQNNFFQADQGEQEVNVAAFRLPDGTLVEFGAT